MVSGSICMHVFVCVCPIFAVFSSNEPRLWRGTNNHQDTNKYSRIWKCFVVANETTVTKMPRNKSSIFRAHTHSGLITSSGLMYILWLPFAHARYFYYSRSPSIHQSFSLTHIDGNYNSQLDFQMLQIVHFSSTINRYWYWELFDTKIGAVS